MDLIICQTCGEHKEYLEFQPTRKPLTLCKDCFLKKRREYHRIYNRTYYQKPERKEKQREYDQKPEAKERRRNYSKQRWDSPEGKAKVKAYKKSPEGKASAKACREKPETKEYQREYHSRPEYRIKIKEYNRLPETINKSREYRNRVEVRSRDSGNKRRNARTLNHNYIKMLIRNRSNGTLKAKDIPPELIELQTQSLILKRLLKQKNKEDEPDNLHDM
jgi:hypothetical protein